MAKADTRRNAAPVPEQVSIAAGAAEDKKATDLVALDLRKASGFTDFFLVATGSNARQVRAIADNVMERLAERGDPSATIDDEHFSLEPLLELAARDEAGGLGDAPWPPHFAKQEGEPKRVQPSRAKK